MLQGRAIEELHRDVGAPSCFADFVNRADVGMVQSGGGTGFTPKAFQSLRVFGHIIGQELECDEAAQVSVFSLVNNAHPTPAEFLDNVVVRDGSADQAAGIHARILGQLVSEPSSSDLNCRSLQEVLGLFLRAQQRPNLPLQRRIRTACPPQKRLALLRRLLQDGLQQVIDLFPAFSIHRLVPPASSR